MVRLFATARSATAALAHRVLDTKDRCASKRRSCIDAAEGQPARLVLDLVATDRASFMRNIALANRPRRKVHRQAERSACKVDGDARPLIVIDPGHGGIDTRHERVAGGELEKDIVAGLLRSRLREKLEANGKYRVAMTRSGDEFIPRSANACVSRVRAAQRAFISIHADALPKRGRIRPEGATVYALSENASDAEAARLAETENKADVIAGVDLDCRT